MLDVQAFDTKGTGYLPPHDLLAGCAGLGLILSEKELTSMAHYSGTWRKQSCISTMTLSQSLLKVAGLSDAASDSALLLFFPDAVNTAAGAGSSGGAHSHESSGAILNEEGQVHYMNFLALLSAGPGALAKR